jgi:hypothetical protein
MTSAKEQYHMQQAVILPTYTYIIVIALQTHIKADENVCLIALTQMIQT